MDILKKLREEFGITQSQAENTVRLLDEGNMCGIGRSGIISFIL